MKELGASGGQRAAPFGIPHYRRVLPFLQPFSLNRSGGVEPIFQP